MKRIGRTTILGVILILGAGCNMSGSPTTSSAAESAVSDAKASEQKAVAPANEMPCGMGQGGGCCGTCQEKMAEKKADGAAPAAGAGGCPCMKGKKAKPGS